MKNRSGNSFAARKAEFFILSSASIFASAVLAALWFSFASQILLFAAIIAICPLFYFVYRYFRSAQIRAEDMQASKPNAPSTKEIFNSDVEEKLVAFEQIGEFFGSSLKPADMFRLIGNRIGEIIPFDGCFLFLSNGPASGGPENILRLAQVISEEPSYFTGLAVSAKEGLLGKALAAERVMSDGELPFREKLFPQHFNSSIASPITDRDGEVLGMLALSSVKANAYDKSSLVLLQAIVERVSSLINSSFNNQRNNLNALTNRVTGLPNEAAFYLILEQQISEAQRFSQKNALTVLCVDIKGFSNFNQEHGHAAGDALLTHTARIIRDQLRQMDFLSHPSADEFWAILPGASSNIVELVIERLDRAFAKSRFTTPANAEVEIELNFGTATFKKDGETALDMTQTALRRKALEKNPTASDANAVLHFPLRNQQIGDHPF